MIFWNTQKLSDALREGRVTTAQSALYLAANVLIWSLLVELAAHVQTPKNILDYVLTAVSISSAIFGTWICYRANARGDNRDFIERYVCLSLPITVRVLVIEIALLIVVFSAESTAGTLSDQTTIPQMALYLVLIFAFYRLMWTALLRTSRAVDEFGYQTHIANARSND